MKSFSYKCQISFTEIYKETVYDLLDQEKRTGSNLESYPVVQIFEAEEGIVLRNLSVYEVTSEEEALQLFFMGNANRITSSTTMNNASSRSHAVFTIVLETEGIKDDRTVFTAGKINLVDLAGSERMYKVSRRSFICFFFFVFLIYFLLAVQYSTRDQRSESNQSFSAFLGTSDHLPSRTSITRK
jgi:hypothetical protein